MTAIIGFTLGLACGAVLCWILLALAHRPPAPRAQARS
jgi:hypothetical protein